MKYHPKLLTPIIVFGTLITLIALSHRGYEQQVQMSLHELSNAEDEQGRDQAWNRAVNCQGAHPCGILTSASTRISAFHQAQRIKATKTKPST